MKKMISIRIEEETLSLLKKIYNKLDREEASSWETWIESLLLSAATRQAIYEKVIQSSVVKKSTD